MINAKGDVAVRRAIAPLALAAILASALPVQAAGATVKDMSGHWARTQVEVGVEAGYVAGYPDGTFRPDAPITRAEFMKLLGAAMRLEPGQGETGFVEEHGTQPHWAFTQGYIEAAVTAGLLLPPDYNGALGPDVPITRREIVMAAIRATGKEALAGKVAMPGTVTDAGGYADWLRNWAAVAMDAGIITGYPDGSLGLGQTATRAEALVMVQRVLNRVTMDLTRLPGTMDATAVRHPGEGEPFWSVVGALPGKPVVTNGTQAQDYTFADEISDLAMLPAPGKALWLRFTSGSAGVVARLQQGELTEAARFEGKSVTLLTVGDDGRLWFTDGANGLQVADRDGKALAIAGVSEALKFGAMDWNGTFWGVSDTRVYRVTADGEAVAYDAEVKPGQAVQHMELADDGALWLFTAGEGDAKVEAIRLAYGKVAQRVVLLNRYGGGVGSDVRIRAAGRSGPFLWVVSQASAGSVSWQEGVYRFNLDTGEAARQVAPRSMDQGATAVTGPDGSALVKDIAGAFWRILP
jgi:hypothetical protein